MKAFEIPIVALLWVLLGAVRGVSGGIGSLGRQHLYSTSLRGGNDSDVADVNVTEVVQPTKLPTPEELKAYASALANAVVVGRPGFDFGRVLRRGDATEIFLALCHPPRLIRSVMLSWVATEAWRRCGLFKRRKRKPKKPQQGKKYRRETMTRKTYKKEIKGLIEEPLEAEQFEEQYASSRRGQQRARAAAATDTFGSLVPESQLEGNLLSKQGKESLVARFEVKSRTPKKPKGKKKMWKFLKLTRRRKFTTAWTLGYLLYPLVLLTPVGGPLVGWMGVLTVAAEGIPWVEKKFKVRLFEDNQLLEQLMEPFQDKDVLKALLFGSLAGALSV